MAIYHFSGTDHLAEAQGRSAVACAAYRSGERLMDERYDKIQDYSRKDDIVHEEILLPENAPEWMADREKLWNCGRSLLKKEKTRNWLGSLTLRCLRELTFEQNLELSPHLCKRAICCSGHGR
jgi:hypothetical protein